MTELLKQLSALKSLSEPPASFLFDPKVAQKIDKDIIFTIGLNGFEELRNDEEDLIVFYSELFDEKWALDHSSREKLLKPEQDFIESELLKINKITCRHFLKPASHKIIEFLLRFYKIHTVIKDELLFSLLPYHGTKYFIRLLQICKLDGIWIFLSKHQHSGYILQRSDIVKQCVHELSLLQGLIDRAFYSEIHMKFVASVIIEIVKTLSTFTESFLIMVFAYVEKIIRESPRFHSIAMALISQIASRHPFSPQYLQAIIADLLKYSEENIEKAVLTINLLLKIHKSKSLPNNILKDLSSEKILRAMSNISQTNEISDVICLISSKVFNNILKNEKKVEEAQVLCRDIKLNGRSITSAVHSLFTHFLNIEKGRKALLQPSFCSLLSLINNQDSEYLLRILPSTISQFPPESKSKLYELISAALSGLPFDTSSDLPIVLALTHSHEEIRQSALTQITDPAQFFEPLSLLIIKESSPSVLLSALSLPLTTQFNPILIEKFIQSLKSRCLPTIYLPTLFTSLINTISTFTTQHARLILTSYDIASLRDLSMEAVSKCKDFPLFSGYKGEALALFLTRKFVNNWNDLCEFIVEFIEIPVISGLIISVFEYVMKKQENLKNFVRIAAEMIKWDVRMPVMSLLSESMVRLVPVLGNVGGKERELMEEALKELLVCAIPKKPELCKEVLAKFFPDCVLQVLCQLSERSPEALHLAACVAFHSKKVDAVFYVFPYLILNLARDMQYRASSIFTIQQFLNKNLPEIHIEFTINLPDLSMFTPEVANLKRLLKKILKYKGSITQDGEFLIHIIRKCYFQPVEGFLAHAVSLLSYGKLRYLEILSEIVSDTLTASLIPYCSTLEEKKAVLSRLKLYQDWKSFTIIDFLLESLRSEDLFLYTLPLISATHFADMISHQSEIFSILLKNLPKHSLFINDHTEDYNFSSEILIHAFSEGLEKRNYEALLQVVQSNKQCEKLLACLLAELKRLNLDGLSEEAEYLRGLLLISIRIQGAGAFIKDEDIAEILKTLTSPNVETRKNAVLALCGFNEKILPKIISLIETSISNVSTLEDFRFLSSVLYKFGGFRIDIIVKQLIQYSFTNLNLSESLTLIQTAGAQYLHIFLTAYLASDYQLLFKCLLNFSVSEVLQAFNEMLTTKLPVFRLIQFTFEQEEFVEKFAKCRKEAAEKLAEMFSLIFAVVADMGKVEGADKKQNGVVRKAVRELLGSFNKSLDNKLISMSFSLFLQESNYYRLKEAIQFLVPHVEESPTAYFSLINPLCGILENNISKASVLHSDKLSGLAVFIQMVLSVLYILLKHYKDPSNVLVIYGNCLLGYTKSSRVEVQCAACLCFSAFFKEKSMETLPFLDTYFDQVASLCESSEETVRAAGVSSLIPLIRACEEFLSPYTGRILEISCRLDRKSLYKTIAKSIPHRFLIENLIQTCDNLGKQPELLIHLFEICSKACDSISAGDLSVLTPSLFAFFKSALNCIINFKGTVLRSLSEAISKSFAAFSLNLKSVQFKSGFLEIFQWTVEKNEESAYDLPRVIAFSHLVTNLTSSLKHLFIPYYSHFLEVFLEIMSLFFAAYSVQKRKRFRGKLLRLANDQILLCCKQLALNDTERYLTVDKYEKIAECFSSQFKCVYIKDYSEFCESRLIPSVVQFLTSTFDQTVWQSFTYKILLNSRSSESSVRLYSLKCVSRGLSAVGKEFAGLIGDIMPFVLEGLEDVDDSVTEVAKTLLSQLESYCGEEIQFYLR